MRDFYQEIIDIIGSGGEPCCVIPVSNPAFENAAHETVTSKGQGVLDGLVFTYDPGARTSFAKPTEYARNQFRTPFQPVNGTSEGLATPDIAAFSRDDTAGEGFSWGGWIQPGASVTDANMMGKFETTGSQREWLTRFISKDRASFNVQDESAGVGPNREVNSSVSFHAPGLIVGVYDGSGGASAMDGVDFFYHGLLVAATSANNGSYVGMEAGTAPFDLLQRESGDASWFNDKGGTIFFTHRELSAVEAFNLNDVYVAMQRADRSRLLAGVL